MEAVLEAPKAAGNLVDRFAHETVRDWLNKCDEFRRWEYNAVLVGDASAETLAEHRRGLKYMISTTRVMAGSISDPEFFEAGLFSQLQTALFLLEGSWEMVHRPIPPEEVKTFLAEVFPE